MAERQYNRIKGALADKGKTNLELAAYIKKSPNTVSRYCQNETQPPIEVLYKIADFLDVDARDLLLPSKGVGASRKKS